MKFQLTKFASTTKTFGAYLIRHLNLAANRRVFYLPPEADARFGDIFGHSLLDKDTDLVAAAVDVYRDLQQLTLLGCSVFIRKPNGERYLFSIYGTSSYAQMNGTGGKDDETALAARLPIRLTSRKARKKEIRLSKATWAKLNVIRTIDERANRAEALRIALGKFVELQRAMSKGEQIFIRDRRKNEIPYAPFTLIRGCLRLGS